MMFKSIDRTSNPSKGENEATIPFEMIASLIPISNTFYFNKCSKDVDIYTQSLNTIDFTNTLMKRLNNHITVLLTDMTDSTRI